MQNNIQVFTNEKFGIIDSIVMVLRPGDVPKVMTESKCYEAVERHGQFCSGITINEPNICAYGLKAAYDPRTILPLGDERYITGLSLYTPATATVTAFPWMPRTSWPLSSILTTTRSCCVRTAKNCRPL